MFKDGSGRRYTVKGKNLKEYWFGREGLDGSVVGWITESYGVIFVFDNRNYLVIIGDIESVSENL